MRSVRKLAAVFAMLAGASSAAQGAIQVTTDSQSGPTPFTPTYSPSSTDLINGLTPSASAGAFTDEGSAGLPALTNGTFGTIDRSLPDAQRNAIFAAANLGESVTYTLPQTSNLTSIVVYGGWQDNGRDDQAYTISYATTAVPTFTQLTSVEFVPAVSTGGIPVASRVTITDTTGTLLSNVTALRFDFANGPGLNGYQGYAEIDVIGAAVPEPASLALLGLAGVTVVARRRRRV